MVSTRSGQNVVPSFSNQSWNVNPEAVEHQRGRSKSPAKQAPVISSPPSGVRSAISDFATAFSYEPSDHVGNIPDTPVPALGQLHNSSDLLTTPSTFLEYQNGKFVRPGDAPASPISGNEAPAGPEDETAVAGETEPVVEVEVPAKAETELKPMDELLSQLQAEAEAEAAAEAEAQVVASDTPANPEVNASPSPHLPTYRSSESLRLLISGSRQTLSIEAEKLEEMLKPETGEVLQAHLDMNGLLSQYEQAKREYEWRRTQHEIYAAQQVEIRNRRRQLDEAERELDELCH